MTLKRPKYSQRLLNSRKYTPQGTKDKLNMWKLYLRVSLVFEDKGSIRIRYSATSIHITLRWMSFPGNNDVIYSLASLSE